MILAIILQRKLFVWGLAEKSALKQSKTIELQMKSSYSQSDISINYFFTICLKSFVITRALKKPPLSFYLVDSGVFRKVPKQIDFVYN